LIGDDRGNRLQLRRHRVPEKPTITAVVFTGTQANPTVTITDTFGAEPAPNPLTPRLHGG
jgi:hypothetical protein